MRTEKLHVKNISKLASRLLKTYALDESCCPNIAHQKYYKNLRYLVYRRYIEKSLMYEPWEDLVQACISEYSNLHLSQAQINELKRDFIELLAINDENREVCKWTKRLNVNANSLPEYVTTFAKMFAHKIIFK